MSGGSDSLALLVLAHAAGCIVTAWHVDHQLRAGSAAEADVVGTAAARYGAGFRSVRVDVGSGPNLEARARRARYAALPPDVLTGHTADDQAETVLLALLRGCGADGLAGMRADERRPLLALRRRDTVALCRNEGLQPVVDPSNLDPAHRRNRIRHELLPLAADIAGRDVVPLVARAASLVRADTDFLAGVASELLIDATDAAALRRAPSVLARRAIRRWLATEVLDGYPPDLASVERVLGVARGETTACQLGGGWRVARRANRLRVERGGPLEPVVPEAPATA